MLAAHVHDDRIAVQVPERGSEKLQRELRGFVRYCIQRIERELGERGTWSVVIELAPTGYASCVTVCDRGVTLEDRRAARDGGFAVWDALCCIEQRLREHR